MKNFNYCIWLTMSDNTHPWFNYIEDFDPHITLYYNLTLKDAKKKIKELNELKLDIKLVENMKLSEDDGFYAIYFNVENKDNILPENAHVSFKYKYDSFSEDEKKKIESIIIQKTGLFDKIIIKKCTGHYHDWKLIN